jgi:hypothetical protein
MAGKGVAFPGLALALLVLPLAMADVAGAQDREFTGEIEAVTKDALVVASRMGDTLRFERTGRTAVSGGSAERRRATWADLEPGDRVSVRWKLMDEPRKAYEVIVLSPRID